MRAVRKVELPCTGAKNGVLGVRGAEYCHLLAMWSGSFFFSEFYIPHLKRDSH